MVCSYFGAGAVETRLKMLNCKKVYCPFDNTIEQAAFGKLKQGTVM